MELKDSLKNLPQQPGIYFMKNSMDMVIYVGKAKNLKARVSQYFQNNRNHSPKIVEMVSQIYKFEYTVTDTELEAFLLECNTIRELKPRYNKLLKNYKDYRYIRIPVNDKYPKVSIETKEDEGNALYFGPFSSKSSVEHAVEFLKDYYPIRKCSRGSFERKSAGCLNFSLGNCLGPCRDVDIHKEYKDQISNIIQLLEGKDSAPVKELIANMKSAAGNMDFEKAVKYRDQIRGIRHVINKQRLVRVCKYGRNTLAIERYGEDLAKLFIIKGNKLVHIEKVSLSDFNRKEFEEKLKYLANLYFKDSKKIKRITLNQEDVDEAQIIHSYLKKNGSRVRSFNIPASRIGEFNYGKIIGYIVQMR